MSIPVTAAGEFGGHRVDEAVLTSDTGVSIALLNWGVVLRDWRVPVKGGERSVVLGFKSFEPYPEHSPFFGAIAGRVANRIGGARFTLDGTTYELTPNEGPNQLHGGPEGLSRQVWTLEPDAAANAVRFTHKSPDGAMGYPGNVDFTVTYTLTGNRLALDFVALPDRPTPISLVQHHYFNLGHASTVLDHIVHLPACTARTEVGSDLLPTGEIVPVAGTKYDFTTPRSLRGADGEPVEFDDNMVLASDRDKSAPVAVVKGDDGALTLRLWSDRPGLQFYDSVWTDVKVPGLGGRTYGKYAGLCLEDQMFPDALNHPNFPSVICTPDAPYKRRCEIEIG